MGRAPIQLFARGGVQAGDLAALPFGVGGGVSVPIVRPDEATRQFLRLESDRGNGDLLQRYTRQLDAQENKLEALRREIATTTSRRDRAEQEVNALIGIFTDEG
jgi:hypothetical protein